MRLAILVLIFIATIINYLDRGAMSFAILPMQRDLGIDDVQFGIAASAFAVGYTAMIFFAGFIVDRFGSIKTWAASALLWSLVTVGIGFSRDFETLVALRIALGLVEAVHFPALLKTVADWLEPRWMARSISFALLGVPFASLIGAPLVTSLIESAGWRSMFFILGALGFAWAVLWLRTFHKKTNPRLNRLSYPFESADRLHWKAFFKNSSLIASCTVFFIFGYILFFALFWIPGYLEKIHHVSIRDAGWIVMLPWLFASILILLGGAASDFLMKKTRSLRYARVYPTACSLLIAGLAFYLLSRATHLHTAVLLVSVGLGFTFAINAPIYAFNADLFPSREATAQGISGFFFSLAGIVAPALTGWLVQTSGNFKLAIFVVACLAVFAAGIAFAFQRPQNIRN